MSTLMHTSKILKSLISVYGVHSRGSVIIIIYLQHEYGGISIISIVVVRSRSNAKKKKKASETLGKNFCAVICLTECK